MRNVIVTYGQTIFDIAIQEYGTYEGVFLLMEDNNLGLDSEITAGEMLLVRELVPELDEKNLQTSSYLKANSIAPNAAFVSEAEAEFELDDYDTGYLI